MIKLLRDDGRTVVEQRLTLRRRAHGRRDLLTGNYGKVQPVTHIDDRRLAHRPALPQGARALLGLRPRIEVGGLIAGNEPIGVAPGACRRACRKHSGPDLESRRKPRHLLEVDFDSPLLAIRRSGGALFAAFLLGATGASAVAAEPTERGRDLAATCTGCHNTNGKAIGEGKPIAGMAAERIVTLMTQFRDGTRPATVMHQIAKGYTPEQIRLIADYLAAQK